MKVSGVIDRLQEEGYSITLDGDKLRLRYERDGEPGSEVGLLLGELRAHKEEAITLLREVHGEPEPLPLETLAKPPQAPPAVASEAQGSLPLTQTGEKVLTIQEPQTPRHPQGQPSAKMASVKICSRLFNEEIWLVADQEEMEALVSKGVKEAIYMAWEIPVLKGKDRESLRAVHMTKKTFPGSALA